NFNRTTTGRCYWVAVIVDGRGDISWRRVAITGVSRRRLLVGAAAFGGTVPGGGVPRGQAAPGVVTSDGTRPQIPYGVMSGDPTGGRAIIWSKTDRPARMLVEYATREDFRDAQQVAGPAALAVSDYTARVDLGPLPPGGQMFYRVTFQDLADLKTLSAPAPGMLRMPGGDKRNITFAYSGDEAGQGWGINPEWGGYRVRNDAAPLSRFLHPFWRPNLCRWPDRRRGQDR